MNTNRFLLPPRRRRSRFLEIGKIFWAVTTVFTGLLLAVIYCILTNRLPA